MTHLELDVLDLLEDTHGGSGEMGRGSEGEGGRAGGGGGIEVPRCRGETFEGRKRCERVGGEADVAVLVDRPCCGEEDEEGDEDEEMRRNR